MVGGLAPPDIEDEQEQAKDASRGVIFVLESAQLEVAQVGKVRGLLHVLPAVHKHAGNSDIHLLALPPADLPATQL
jgi:hypothetical protein